MSKYVDFANINDIMADLTPGENKEMKTIEADFENKTLQLKEELEKLEPPNPPKNWERKIITPQTKKKKKNGLIIWN